jgi:hypothetical protein
LATVDIGAGITSPGITLGAGDTVTNEGTIAGAGTGVGLGVDGVIDNSGIITGAAGYGVDVGASSTVTNEVSGQITGSLSGINAGASSILTNSGSVVGSGADGAFLGAGASFTNTSAGTVNGATAGLVVGAEGTVSNAGSITGGTGDGVDIAANGTITNAASGTISGTGTGITTGANGTIITAGTITGGNGTAVLFGPGSNRLVLTPDAVLNGMAVGVASATNTLELTAGTGTLTAYAADFINFQNIVVDAGAHWIITGGDATPGSITVADGASVIYDGVTYGTLCFCAGTLIATEHGEVAVEDLVIGDCLITLSGETAPIRWIGVRAVSTRFSDPLRTMPIRIRAGALADRVPRRDLLVSPDHALFIDDVLIQAAALVNGVSITQETHMPDRFFYYHIELEQHALILAEGALTETFVDNVDRMAFDNWAEHRVLFGDNNPIEEMPYPRAKSARQVPRSVRTHLAARQHNCVEALAAAS